jgi:hypothetical protein
MFDSIMAILLNSIVPFSIGLFFYVISPLIKSKDLKISEVSRKTGLVMLIIVTIWIVIQLLKVLF